MPSLKHEKRSLLVLENSASDNFSGYFTGSSSEDDDLIERGKSKYERYIRSESNGDAGRGAVALHRKSQRHRHQIHRSVCRIVRLLCTLIVFLLFVMIYVPLYSNVQTRQVALPDWGYNTSRNISDYVLPDNNTNILEPRNICHDKIFLLIIVCSAMDNFAARQTIRGTWGNTTDFNYGMFAQLHRHLHGQYLEPTKKRLKYYSEYIKFNETQTTIVPPPILSVRIVFLVGRSKFESSSVSAHIRNESELYDDIIQENFIDSYNNLTLKSVLALKWLKRNCMQHIAFFMKCDDDTFVNVPNLLHYLLGGTIPLYNDTVEFFDAHTYQVLSHNNRLNATRDYLAGHLFCTARPVTDVSSKWYMPFYMYPGDKYPKYLSGAGYVMSIDVVPRLYETALNTTLIYMEDVYLTGMCAERLKLKRKHHPLFSYTRSQEMCSFKGSITQHEVKDDDMVDAYTFVTNISSRCPPPAKYFKRVRLRKNNYCV